jgi:centrosomal protein CEP57
MTCRCSEHQELSHEISEATDPQIREDLERELDALVTRMESKSQQISKIRRHQNKVSPDSMNTNLQNQKTSKQSKSRQHEHKSPKSGDIETK